MDIRFRKANGIHAPGATVRNYHSGAAAELIRRGIAEAAGTVAATPTGKPQSTGTRKKYYR